MRLLLCLLLLAGCSAPVHLPETQPAFSSAEASPYRLLAATPEHPLRVLMVATEGFEFGAEAHASMQEQVARAIPVDAFEVTRAPKRLAPVGHMHEWSDAELDALHERLVQTYPRSKGPTIFVAYLDGNYGPSKLAGQARGNLATLYPQTFDAARDATGVSNPLGDPAVPVMERAVLTHEVGHVLGLVGHIMQTTTRNTEPADDPCGCHSRNEDSVMAPRVGYVNAMLEQYHSTGAVPYTFDGDDVADLETARKTALARYG